MSNKKTHTYKRQTAIDCYIMMLPQIIGFFIFTIYPIFWAARYSLYYFNGWENSLRFVGFENFLRVFSDTRYWQGMLNSFMIMFLKLPLEFFLAISIGILLNKKIRGFSLLRNIYFFPNIISTAIIGLIFTNMFAAYNGIVNNMLMKTGIIDLPIHWFSSKPAAMFVIILASTWQTFGVNILYVISALQSVPNDVYESAALDGANSVQVLRKITLPMIAPALSIIIMLAINGTLQSTELVLVLTNGAPSGSTEVVMTYVLKNMVHFAGSAYNVNIGYGAATAIITAIIFACVTLIYLHISKKYRELY